MNIQKSLSNKTINGIVHCILVQRGHIIALDIQVNRYRHRCAYTGSGVHLYQIKAFLPPLQTYFLQNTSHYVGISFYSLELFESWKNSKN